MQISGFTREELLGKATISCATGYADGGFQGFVAHGAGRAAWRGLVKTAVKMAILLGGGAGHPAEKNGQIIGYMSVRTRQIRRRALRPKRATAPQACKDRLPASGRRSVSLGTRLRAAIATLGVLCALLGFFGVQTLNNGVEALHAMYQHRTTLNVINRVMFLLADNRSQIMLSLQHDPGSPVVSQHDHPLDMHVQTTLKTVKKSTPCWRSCASCR